MQELEPELTALGLDSGASTREWFASYDPASSLWRMSQGSLFEAWAEYSETWPRSGMTRSGRAFERPTWAPRIDDPACLSWPTPRETTERTGRGAMTVNQQWAAPSLEQITELAEGILPREFTSPDEIPGRSRRLWPTPTDGDASAAGNRNLPGSKAQAGLSLTDVVTGGQAPRQWPTPTCQDAENAGGRGATGTTRGRSLSRAVDSWPTPQARDKKGSDLPTRHGGASLSHFVQTGERTHPATWPTPQSYSAPEGQGKPTSTPLDQAARSAAGLPVQASRNTGGNLPASSVVLNPAWVSCLMGFPPDWCDIGAGPLPRSATP